MEDAMDRTMDHRAIFETETAFEVGYDPAVPCVTMAWRGYHTSEAFRAQNERVLAELTERRASKMLCDIRYFVLIGATDQDWLNTNWLPRAAETGLRTCAIVAPVFYFNRVAVHSVVERIDTQTLSVAHFDATESARAWLRTGRYENAPSPPIGGRG
jgi:hypothetical protein